LIKIIEGSFDACEAYIHQEVKINLKEAGLTDPYFEEASLTINADKNESGKTSSTKVRLR